ncbi:hypothetical protein [Haloarchaeobius sp. TZWWS8]|uniref:hypothetical protein n=1 Tax=Haloarchaeobius sp. TZWWS8 TaxID=3446121 RepID=UPI003EB96C63
MATTPLALAEIDSDAETHSVVDGEDAQLVAGSCRTGSIGRDFAAEFGCAHSANVANMRDWTSFHVRPEDRKVVDVNESAATDQPVSLERGR